MSACRSCKAPTIPPDVLAMRYAEKIERYVRAVHPMDRHLAAVELVHYVDSTAPEIVGVCAECWSRAIGALARIMLDTRKARD